MVTASLNNFRQTPRKMRLVANLIKGKSVAEAKNVLAVTVKRAAEPILKLVDSAIANAKQNGIEIEGLYVKECRVDSGITMKRFMPGARGSAFPIKKKASRILLTLDLKGKKAISAPKAEKTEKVEKTEKKPKATKKVTKK